MAGAREAVSGDLKTMATWLGREFAPGSWDNQVRQLEEGFQCQLKRRAGGRAEWRVEVPEQGSDRCWMEFSSDIIGSLSQKGGK